MASQSRKPDSSHGHQLSIAIKASHVGMCCIALNRANEPMRLKERGHVMFEMFSQQQQHAINCLEDIIFDSMYCDKLVKI